MRPAVPKLSAVQLEIAVRIEGDPPAVESVLRCLNAAAMKICVMKSRHACIIRVVNADGTFAEFSTEKWLAKGIRGGSQAPGQDYSDDGEVTITSVGGNGNV